jgi:hypothetical protein
MKSQQTRRQTLRALGVIASATALGTGQHAAAADGGGAFLLVTHEVEDFDRWLPVFEGTAALKRKHGWKQSTVFSVDGDRKHVMVLEEFGNLDRAKAFAGSPELKAAMAKGGVASAPEVRFVTMVSRAKA